MAYKPVLANFCEIDGVRDFTGHDFDIDNDGNYIYYEKQIGCFTSDLPVMKQDEQNEDNYNIYAKVAIPRQYTDAAEIIERKGGTDCSVELAINDLSWDQDNHCLVLNDITVMGLTCLGVDPDSGEKVKPGMKNAHIQLEDFSLENNSLTFNSNIIQEIADAVANKLGNNNQGKEESKLDFQEEMKEVEIEASDVAINSENDEAVKDETNNEVFDDTDTTDTTDNTDNTEDGDTTDDTNDDSEEEIDLDDDGNLNNGQQQDKRTFTINNLTFEVSMSEVIYSLWELVNNTYGETDNDYYDVEVYEASKTIVMVGLFTGRSFRQGYKVRNNVYSLVGDRISVKPVFVTADEEAELDKMRSNYSSIADKLAKYESEPEKMTILNSSDYISIADEKDFEELRRQENHFDLTVDEVKNKADSILLQYAKSGKLSFAKQDEEVKHNFVAFAKVERDTSFLDKVLNSSK